MANQEVLDSNKQKPLSSNEVAKNPVQCAHASIVSLTDAIGIRRRTEAKRAGSTSANARPVARGSASGSDKACLVGVSEWRGQSAEQIGHLHRCSVSILLSRSVTLYNH